MTEQAKTARKAMAEQSATWLREYLKPLEGATIQATGATVEDDGFGLIEAWPRLIVKAKDGTVYDLQVSQDEEGNGPGFLFGLPNPNQEEA
jgi:hypothetical protein